jgi:hypothetical protein
MKKIAWVLIAVLSASAWAVTTAHWTADDQSDFKAGTLHNVVASNLGDLKLSRAVSKIMDQNAHVSSVYALVAGADGTIYAGTGPDGVLLAVKGDAVSTAATLDPGVNIYSLLVEPGGALLIGTGGEKGRVLRMDRPGDKPHEIFSADGVQYVYAMVRGSDGEIYAATGPNGQLFRIKADGSHDVLYKSSEDNLLTMIGDGKDQLFIGTHPNGLVIRVDRHSGQAFIMYNADESEITALALDGTGNLFAATGQESSDSAPQPAAGGKGKAGRPDSSGGGPMAPAGNSSTTTKKTTSMAPSTTVHPLMLSTSGAKPSDDAPPDNADGDGDGGPPGPSGDHASSAGSHDQSADNSPGNAVYKIDSEGFVTEVFRQHVTIYSMIAQDGNLIVGTAGGLVYQINPAAEETVILAKVEPKEVTALLATTDSRVILGMANAGALASMTRGYAHTGTYQSAALDADQVSRFGKIQIHDVVPPGATLTISTRSGNTEDPEAGGWSAWGAEQPVADFVPAAAPPARFLQYRVTFTSSADGQTPVVNSIDVAYQTPNLAPVVKALKVEPSPLNQQLQQPGHEQPPDGGPGAGPPRPDPNRPIPTPFYQVNWDASDPNGDAMTYSLYAKLNGQDWILIKDKLKQSPYQWDTRNVADGRYQLKLVASDAPANPPGQEKTGSRVSDPIVVDNTAPTITITGQRQQADHVIVDLRVTDVTSTVASASFSVDSADDWKAILPSDNIWDSPSQTAALTLSGLSPGQHQLSIRAADAHGNLAYASVVVTVNRPAGR